MACTLTCLPLRPLINGSHQILLSIFFVFAQLGMYVTAVVVSQLQQPIASAFADVGFPCDELKMLQAPAGIIRRALRNNLLISVTTSTATIALMPLIINLLFGSSYLEAVTSARLLVFGGDWEQTLC